MPVLNIEGRKVTVDDRFLKLSPEDQQNTVDEIASSFAPAPDKYQQAAIDEQADLKTKGIDEGAGYTRRLVHGATLGADSTLIAGALAPIEAIRRGVGLGEGYDYAKAREDRILNDARANTGAYGTAAEVLGGGATGLGLGPLSTGRLLSSSPGIVGRTLSSATDAAALGGVAGFNEGNSLQERLANAGQGVLLGGAVGGALPIAGAVARATGGNIISNIAARLNPTGYAERQVARAISESGRPTADIANDVVNAATEGQGAYNLADAMGNSGQRLLSSVARAPGEGRTAVVNALEGRQGLQGRRISNALAEGFNAPETAAQTEARLTAARNANADVAYSAVRSDANPVDLSNAIAHLDETLSPGVNQTVQLRSNLANDSAEQALQHFRDRLTDGRSILSDFAAIQRVRGDLSDTIQSADRAGAGNKARLLRGLLRQLDSAMEDASAGHLAANKAFSQASRDIEGVQTGREAAMRGRTEDTIPRYQSLSPQGQQAFRSGYVDPLIAQTQGAAFGVNKARPLLNDAFAAEADAMAPGNPLMQRRLAREQTMFETRGQALGGSKTFDHGADSDALGIDPSLIGHIVTHNYGGAVKHLIQAGSNAVTGNTPAVRAAVADILLRRGASITPAALEEMVGKTIQRIQFAQALARTASNVGAGAIAVTPAATTKPNIFPKRKAQAK
jgi:hypothetical protein